MHTGDWEAARTELAQAVDLHRQLGISSRTAWALRVRGGLHLRAGAWEEATSDLEESLAVAERGGDRLDLLGCHGGLAEIAIGKGQPAVARARLLPLLDHPDMRRQLLAYVLPRLAWAQLELGEPRQAAELVTESVSHAREAGEPVLLAEILWLQALVATRQQHWEEAESALEEGLSLTRSMLYPYMEARTLWVYGVLHSEKGEPEPARERLEAALAIFRRLGAQKDAERIEQLLTSLGCATSRRS
jgi:tetratricopeptide (TPR) repeat protein